VGYGGKDGTVNVDSGATAWTALAASRAVSVSPLYSRRLVLLVAAFGVGMALSVAIATAASFWAGYIQAVAAAESTTRSLARAVADSVARSVQSVQVTLTSVAELAGEGGLDHGLDLDVAVAQRLLFTPHLRQVLVIRADGWVLFDSAGIAGGRRLDIGDMLADHRRMPRPLVIGAALAGRFIGGEGNAAGQSLIPMSRAITDGRGGIRALVVAAVNPGHFLSIFDAIEADSHVNLHLWRFDGTLLVADKRIGGLEVAGHAGLPLFDALATVEQGTFRGGDGDGVERITSYRTTLAWPLVVSVGIPTEAALASWREGVRAVGWPVGCVSLAVLGLTLVLVRTLARRAQDEAALRLSDRVLATVSNGVAIADAALPDLPLVYVNPAFERITGYRAEDALGRNSRFLHAGAATQEPLDDIRKAIGAGGSASAVLRNFRADGTPFWNHLSINAVHDHAGRITHFVGVQRDITEEEEAHAALAKAYAEIASFSADLERFSFVLAHHLQEPARQMRVQAQLLLRQVPVDADPAITASVDLIAAGGKRLTDLLRDVQLYLAVERLPVEGGGTAADTALTAALAETAQHVRQAGLVVERGELPSVAVPRTSLTDLFAILIENAATYRHPQRPARLTVAAERVGERWLFRFADNGIGIEPRYHQRIFLAFERLHGIDAYPGTGIGLAIARKIVETAGGRIRVESDGVSGSTFCFTLPAADQ
jgi:two-component system, chemotaxis family, sensor kinase Cph1